MALVAPRAKLFHAIVVVGLSTASAGCGTSAPSEGRNDAGGDAPAEDAADSSAPDAPSEASSVVDAATDGAGGRWYSGSHNRWWRR